MPAAEPQYEPPRLQRLYDYWRSKCQGDCLPARADIDPVDIPELLPGMILVDVETRSGTRRYRFRLLGTEFVAAVGEDLTGKWLDEIGPSGNTDPVIATYDEAVATKRPHYWESILHVEGRDHVRYQRLVCPLASDGQTVDMLVAVFQFETPAGTRAAARNRPRVPPAAGPDKISR